MTDFTDGTGNELEEPEISYGDRKQEIVGKKKVTEGQQMEIHKPACKGSPC